jgi:predicted nucleic acid-binding protein
MAARYALDTNLYVDAARDPAARAALAGFTEAFAPRLYLAAIVAQELRAGVRPPDERRIERDVIGPFLRCGRVFAPAFADWMAAGDVMRRLAAAGGPPVAEMSRSLVNDILLAISCRAHGVRLVTRNARDFARIAPFVPGFAHDAPWPAE